MRCFAKHYFLNVDHVTWQCMSCMKLRIEPFKSDMGLRDSNEDYKQSKFLHTTMLYMYYLLLRQSMKTSTMLGVSYKSRGRIQQLYTTNISLSHLMILIQLSEQVFGITWCHTVSKVLPLMWYAKQFSNYKFRTLILSITLVDTRYKKPASYFGAFSKTTSVAHLVSEHSYQQVLGKRRQNSLP